MMMKGSTENIYMVRLGSIAKENSSTTELPINYTLVKEIVDYMANHSERVHHPKEDILIILYGHYGHKQEMEDLEQEHELLSDKTHAFQYG